MNNITFSILTTIKNSNGTYQYYSKHFKNYVSASKYFYNRIKLNDIYSVSFLRFTHLPETTETELVNFYKI